MKAPEQNRVVPKKRLESTLEVVLKKHLRFPYGYSESGRKLAKQLKAGEVYKIVSHCVDNCKQCFIYVTEINLGEGEFKHRVCDKRLNVHYVSSCHFYLDCCTCVEASPEESKRVKAAVALEGL